MMSVKTASLDTSAVGIPRSALTSASLVSSTEAAGVTTSSMTRYFSDFFISPLARRAPSCRLAAP